MRVLAGFMALVVLMLTLFGIITLASITTQTRLVTQASHGLVAALLASPVLLINPSWILAPKHKIKLYIVIGLLIALIIACLAVVHIPGIAAPPINGAKRWIRLPLAGREMSFQPSEVVKVAFILLMAWWMQGPARKIETYFRRVFVPCVAMGVVALGFLLQKDYGSIIMLSLVSLILMILGGAKLKHLVPYVAVALILLGAKIASDPARMSRLTSFRNPNIETKAAQHAKIAKLALSAGGVYGVGFGKGDFKAHLPENHTDSIFCMIGEEWGFVGTSTCLALFVAFLFMGLQVTRRAPDMFCALAAFGLTLHISLAAAVNTGMMSGLLPIKGLALPFISYGGSNLFCSIFAAFFLISICLRCKRNRFVDRNAINASQTLLPL